MKTGVLSLALVMVAGAAHANLLLNGDLDKTYQQEIVPGFFLPKPDLWVNDGFRGGNPYEDEMSSEPWAGPAPTPVTTNGVGGTDWAVFFKPFSGSPANGAATGHLYQTVDGFEGLTYTLTGWAGAEANAMMQNAVFALDFRGVGGALIGSSELSLMPNLFTPNGQPFNYKQYTVSGVAPVGTVAVVARVSMIEAMGNPLGGGQAFVVDDFELSAVPEPATMVALALGGAALLRRRSKK